jgi:acetate kinase
MILVLNSGSTSLKFKVFDKKFNEISKGNIEKIGSKHSIVCINKYCSNKSIKNHEEALKLLNQHLNKNIKSNLKFIVHRIVHGGVEFNKPIILNKSVLEKIGKYNNLAPLHNPINIQVAKKAMNIWNKSKHIGVFDTMFFKNLKEVVYKYPIKQEFLKKYFIRKYGFHGFSHFGMLHEVSKILNKKIKDCNIITCHLGGGSSISVIKNGIAIDVSMGFSPLSGLMMMTRCGDIDISIIYQLLKNKIEINEVFKMLNFDSGIKAISGMSDLRDVMILNGYKISGYEMKIKKTKENIKKAHLALDMFIYRIQRYISSYMSLLDNIDAIVFSGGIGERNKDVRNLVMNNKYFKKTKVIVVNCDEEKNMAQLALKKL